MDCAENSDSGEEYDLETKDGGTAKDQRCGKYKQFWLSAQHRHKLLSVCNCLSHIGLRYESYRLALCKLIFSRELTN